MNTMKTKKEVVKWLQQVSTGEVDLGPYGMCTELDSMLSSRYKAKPLSIRMFIYKRMSVYALSHGTSSVFPVPHPKFSAEYGYVSHAESDSSMNDTSPYGLNRRKLAAWLADELDRSLL